MKPSPRPVRLAALLAACAALLSACIPSLSPFYTDADLVTGSPLAGTWELREDGDAEVWTFEQTGPGAYALSIRQREANQAREKTGRLAAHLFRLGDHLFLDLIPTDCDFAPEQADIIGMATFPGHLLARVYALDEEKLTLAFCDWDWLEKQLEANPGALAHHKEESRLILTATTADLQRFVLAHLGGGELFEEPKQGEGTFTRLSGAEAAAPAAPPTS